MSGHLLKLILISAFGRNSDRPLRTAFIKMLSVFCSAIFLGVIIGSVVHKTGLPKDLPALWVGAAYGALNCILMMLICYFIASGSRDVRAVVVERMMAIFPLTKISRWFLTLLPMGIIGLAYLLFIIPITLNLAQAMSLAFGWLLLDVVLGFLAGMGFILLRWPGGLAGKIFAIFGMICLELFLINQSISLVNHTLNYTAIYLQFGVLALCMSGFLQSYIYQNRHHNGHSNCLMIHIPKQLLRSSWYIVKILRNRRTITTVCFSLILCSGFACSALLRHMPLTHSMDWFLFGAVLASAFGSEVRGIARRYKLPEIYETGGLTYFIVIQVLAAVVVGILIGLPLLIATLLNSPINPLEVVAVFLIVQSSATCLGLVASTFFVPENGDLGGQVFTTIAASMALFFVPKAAKFSDMSVSHRSAGWIIICCVSLMIIMLIEHERIKNYANA